MTYPILLALAFLACFSFLSNWATLRRERRRKRTKWVKVTDYEPLRVREEQEN